MDVESNLSRVKYVETNKTGRSIYMVGENTSIVKLDSSSEKQQCISFNPYHPLGFCVDKNDGIWIHDSNMNKLIKLDSLLNREAEWDSNQIEISNKSSTLASSIDGSKVYWYKGSNECIVFNVDTRQEIDTYDYFIENVDSVEGIVEHRDTNRLIVVANNRQGNDSII